MSAPGKLNQVKALLAIGLLALAALGGGAWWASREQAQSSTPDGSRETVNSGDAGAPDAAQRSAGDNAPPETFADQRAWNISDESAWSNSTHEPAPLALADIPWKRDMVNVPFR
jgi:hypothetical protein